MVVKLTTVFAAGTLICTAGVFLLRSENNAAPGLNSLSSVSPIQTSLVVPDSPPMPSPDQKRLVHRFIEHNSSSPGPDRLMPAALPDAPPQSAADAIATNETTPCQVSAHAIPKKMATVELSIHAACFPNHRLTIHHNGMMFTDVTDHVGNLTRNVPALTENAVFVVELANGKGTVTMARVPTIRDVDRVVLQWAGQSDLQVHALEFGASYGEQGHVWSGAPPKEDASPPTGGQVVKLGATGSWASRRAEVYSFPVAAISRQGQVRVSIETEVTSQNCGRDVLAQSVVIRGGAKPRTRELVLSIPGCSAIGDFLVLNNLVDDLMIAER